MGTYINGGVSRSGGTWTPPNPGKIHFAEKRQSLVSQQVGMIRLVGAITILTSLPPADNAILTKMRRKGSNVLKLIQMC